MHVVAVEAKVARVLMLPGDADGVVIGQVGADQGGPGDMSGPCRPADRIDGDGSIMTG